MVTHRAPIRWAARAGAALLLILVSGALLPTTSFKASQRFAATTSTYAATVLADQPVSYWRLDEPPGATTAADSASGGNTGTYTGNVTLGISGALSNDNDTAAQFNGAGSYVSVPDNPNLDVTGDLTVEMWAKPGLLNGTTQTLLTKGTNTSSVSGWQYRMSISSANRWKALLYVGGSSFSVTDTLDTLSLTRWDYLVMVRSGATMTLYVNGQSVGSVADSGATNSTNGTLAFGRAGSYANYYYQGGLDEVAIYNKALTLSQIQAHLAAATGAAPTPTATATATAAPSPTATASATATPSPTATATATPSPTATVAATDPIVMAAGDIACNPTDSSFNGGNGTSTACQAKWTAAELSGATAVLAIGDEQYDCAPLANFQQSYNLSWGQYKSLTYPAAGNHEYKTGCSGALPGAAGYYTYFGTAASPLDTNCTSSCRGYYSFNLGSWHIIVLNSECAQVGGCQAGSPQEQWLAADLAAHPGVCTLAYWHRPYYTSGWSLGDSEMHDIWTDLYNAHADLVLNGHDHDYERFAPQDANGNYDPQGVTEIVVGTGGDSHGGWDATVANSVVRDATTYGALQLTLHAGSYSWQFIGDGHSGTFTDSGSASCH